MSRITHLLVNRAQQWRASSVSDGQGGWSETYAVTNAALPCRANAPKGGQVMMIGDQERLRETRRVFCEPGADVRRKDHLVLLSLVLEVESTGLEAAGTYLALECKVVPRIPGATS